MPRNDRSENMKSILNLSASRGGACVVVAAALLWLAAHASAHRGGGGRGGGGGGGRMAHSSVSGASHASRGGGSSYRGSSGNRASTGDRASTGNRTNTGNVNTGNRVNTGDINIDRGDVNIDVDPGYGRYRHPVAAGMAIGAVAVTTAAVLGASYYTLPPSGCTTVIEDGLSYYYCGDVYYQQTMSGDDVVYVVVEP
jgi:hypothetical protein